MSRTYRKMKLGNWNKSEIAYINWHIRRFTGSVLIRKRKPKERIEAEKVQAAKDREIWDLNHRSNYIITTDDKIKWAPSVYVNKYVYENVYQSREDRIEELRRKYNTFSRDGSFSESSRRKEFKKSAAKRVRRANKKFCKAVICEDNHENMTLPDEHVGDCLYWSFF